MARSLWSLKALRSPSVDKGSTLSILFFLKDEKPYLAAQSGACSHASPLQEQPLARLASSWVCECLILSGWLALFFPLISGKPSFALVRNPIESEPLCKSQTEMQLVFFYSFHTTAWSQLSLTMLAMLGLGPIIYISVLLLNAVAILNEERFLSRSTVAHSFFFVKITLTIDCIVGWGSKGADGSQDDSIKGKLINLTTAIRTLMRSISLIVLLLHSV